MLARPQSCVDVAPADPLGSQPGARAARFLILLVFVLRWIGNRDRDASPVKDRVPDLA